MSDLESLIRRGNVFIFKVGNSDLHREHVNGPRKWADYDYLEISEFQVEMLELLFGYYDDNDSNPGEGENNFGGNSGIGRKLH